MMHQSNGLNALVRVTGKRIKNARSAETTSLLLSHGLFIDGCLSSITVSSIIRPIANRFHIPAVKTALLADSMSGPLVVLCPFSCFAALFIALLHNNGVSSTLSSETILRANPNVLYWMVLPFSFYSLATIATIWMVVRTRISLGGMKRYEDQAKEQNQETIEEKPEGNIWNFIVPTILFPFFILFYLIVLDRGSFSLWQMMTETRISFVLFASSLTTLVLSTLYFIVFEKFTLLKSSRIFLESARSSIPSVTVIILAWTLASLLRTKLNFGAEISSLISGSIPLFLMPLVFFWTCALVSGSLGSSWGTVAIFIPLVAPIIIHLYGMQAPTEISQLPLLIPSLGAVISGAALGDHLSLLSDSTILSAAGARCHPVDHVKTQLPYAFPVFLGSSLGFLVSGLISGYPLFYMATVPLAISIFLSFSTVIFFHRRANKRVRN